MALTLVVEGVPGTLIEDLAQECVDLANRMRMGVVCDFNGTRMYAHAGADPASVIRRVHMLQDLKAKRQKEAAT